MFGPPQRSFFCEVSVKCLTFHLSTLATLVQYESIRYYSIINDLTRRLLFNIIKALQFCMNHLDTINDLSNILEGVF